MKKKIGFIDFHIDEWHANNYPAWIKGSRYADEIELAYAWEQCPGKGRNLQTWCEEFGVAPIQTMEEMVENSDFLMVLAPSNPELHAELAASALRSGKPLYIDKPFTTDGATAMKMFALAKAHDTPLMSSSALRFSPVLQERIQEEFKTHPPEFVLSEGGGGNYPEYAIHQIEMIIAAMGIGIRKLRQIGTEHVCLVELCYTDGRKAFLNFSRTHRFAMSIKGLDTTHHFDGMGDFFPRLIDAILRFYLTGQSPITDDETIEIIKVVDASIRALATPDEWVDVG